MQFEWQMVAFGSRCNLSIRPLLSADLDFRCSSTSSLVLMKYEDVAAETAVILIPVIIDLLKQL